MEPCPTTATFALWMVIEVFSITTLRRPSMIAGPRSSIRSWSHSYSCSVIPSASQCACSFGSAQPRMMWAGCAIAASMPRSGMIGSGEAGANRAPVGAMPGIGNSATRAPASASAALAARVTPSMPASGHGKPNARTVAPVAAARRAISCSRRSPPTTAITQRFQSASPMLPACPPAPACVTVPSPEAGFMVLLSWTDRTRDRWPEV